MIFYFKKTISLALLVLSLIFSIKLTFEITKINIFTGIAWIIVFIIFKNSVSMQVGSSEKNKDLMISLLFLIFNFTYIVLNKIGGLSALALALISCGIVYLICSILEEFELN